MNMRLPYFVPAALCAAVLVSAPRVQAEVQIILHAIDHPDRVHCFIPEQMGYRDAITQTCTSVEPNSEIDVFVYLRGWEYANGAGLRLMWPIDWEYFGWVGDCQPGQVTVTDLQANWIDIGTVFTEQSGGGLLPLGFLSFRTGESGEVVALNTRFCIDDDAACYLSQYAEYPIPIPQLGRVAVGGPGYNPAAVFPVAASTWGEIKATYRE